MSLCLLLWNNAFALETSTGSTATWSTQAETVKNGPQIDDVQALSNQHLRIVFNEGVLLPDTNPEVVFSINPYNNPQAFLKIEKAEYDLEDKNLKTIILTTEKQKLDENYIITIGINLTNLAGDPVRSGVFDTGFFTGTDVVLSAEEILALTGAKEEVKEAPASTGSTLTEKPETIEEKTDLTPPEDITDLMVTQKLLQLNSYLVTLSWKASLNTAGDLIDQILYKSLNRGVNYDGGTSLGVNATKYETTLEGGKEYTFKITTKDRSGNESTGMIKSIRLPQTGPAGMALFGSILSGLGAHQLLSRRKKY